MVRWRGPLCLAQYEFDSTVVCRCLATRNLLTPPQMFARLSISSFYQLKLTKTLRWIAGMVFHGRCGYVNAMHWRRSIEQPLACRLSAPQLHARMQPEARRGFGTESTKKQNSHDCFLRCFHVRRTVVRILYSRVNARGSGMLPLYSTRPTPRFCRKKTDANRKTVEFIVGGRAAHEYSLF